MDVEVVIGGFTMLGLQSTFLRKAKNVGRKKVLRKVFCHFVAFN